MKEVLNEEALAKQRQTIRENESKDFRSKLDKYGKMIKEIHQPKVSESKRQEVEENKQKFPNLRSNILKETVERKSNASEEVKYTFISCRKLRVWINLTN